MPKIGLGIICVLIMVALIPFVLVARSRASRSANPAVHLVHDMDNQSKEKTQSPSPLFADGRSMRPHIEGTLAQEDRFLDPEILNDPAGTRLIDNRDTPLVLSDPTVFAAVMLGRNRLAGMTDEQFNKAVPVTVTKASPTDDEIANDTFYVKTIPPQFKVTADFVHRGQERFNIYCSPCHGQSGYGDGPVNARAKALMETGGDVVWTDPQNLHEPKIHTRPDGNLFNTITNGVRTMPAYDKQISVADRWAIIAYVRALQLSQDAPPEVAGAGPSPKP